MVLDPDPPQTWNSPPLTPFKKVERKQANEERLRKMNRNAGKGKGKGEKGPTPEQAWQNLAQTYQTLSGK
eukprot:gene1024-575_t